MNKRKMYENIMNNVAREVKKALNENMQDTEFVEELRDIMIENPLEQPLDKLDEGQAKLINYINATNNVLNLSSKDTWVKAYERGWEFLIVNSLDALRLDKISSNDARWIDIDKLLKEMVKRNITVPNNEDRRLTGALIFIDSNKEPDAANRVLFVRRGYNIFRDSIQIAREMAKDTNDSNIPGKGKMLNTLKNSYMSRHWGQTELEKYKGYLKGTDEYTKVRDLENRLEYIEKQLRNAKEVGLEDAGFDRYIKGMEKELDDAKNELEEAKEKLYDTGYGRMVNRLEKDLESINKKISYISNNLAKNKINY